jgi:hypothetical protein
MNLNKLKALNYWRSKEEDRLRKENKALRKRIDKLLALCHDHDIHPHKILDTGLEVDDE